MSHGVPRISEVEPRTADAIEKERQEIDAYKLLVKQVNEKIASDDLDSETLGLTTKLLKKNPEYYTVWNHRRRVLGRLIASKEDSQAAEEEIIADLKFLVPLMLKFPKCYWIWNYRLWLLEQASKLLPMSHARSIWSEELGLVSKMLSRDGRNFHGWGYRRMVVAALESETLAVSDGNHSLVQPEFDYTTKMIHTDLSNFSAWHNRSVLIPRLLDEQGAGDQQRKSMLDDELDLIHEALIDPFDQSLWFYHACLTAAFSPVRAAKAVAPRLLPDQRLEYLQNEISFVLEMLDGAEDCKWIYQSLIDLVIEYKDQSNEWPRNGSQVHVQAWMAELKRLDPLRRGRWENLESRLTLEVV